MTQPHGRYAGEIRFDIFCFLDQVRELAAAEEHLGFVPHLVENYLSTTRSNAGQAAWMAGDLLGDHWPAREAVPTLLRLAEHARFAAGRKSAIHGLSHAIEASTPKMAADIKATLRSLHQQSPPTQSHRARRARREKHHGGVDLLDPSESPERRELVDGERSPNQSCLGWSDSLASSDTSLSAA